MTIGGPRPPAAPTRPVTLPTWAAGTRVPTRANTAPLPSPRAAAMARQATVARAMWGWKAATTAPAATTPRAHRITGTPVIWSASQPPTGRARVARTTNPAARLAASVVSRP